MTARSRLRSLVLASALAIALGAFPAPASADTMACGTVLTSSVALTEDITCNGGDGLVLDAPGISLDLAGHTISGPGAGGVRILASGVTVTDTGLTKGAISGFAGGVVLDGATAATVTGLVLTGNERGVIVASSSGNTISGNTITDSVADGIRLGLSSGNTVAGNSLSWNGYGIGIADASGNNTVSGNTVSKNRNAGIAVFCGSSGNAIAWNSVTNTVGGEGHGIIVRSGSDDTRIEGNGANLNQGDGIHIDTAGGCQNPGDDTTPTGTVIVDNSANRNGDDGIDDEPSDAVIAGNDANRNADYGIYAPNATDGGGNTTRNNGGPAQALWGCC